MTKAVSAAMRLRSTTDESALRPEDPTHTIRMALAAGPDQMTSVNGGFPIVHDRQIVGAIGVSNGLRHEDIAVAKAGLAAIGSEETPPS
jgi:glc operon protein GlcG